MKENTQYNTEDPKRYDPEFIELYKGSEIPWNNQNGLFSNRINIKSDPNRLNEINQIASKFDRDIDKIIDMLHSVNYEHDEAIREASDRLHEKFYEIAESEESEQNEMIADLLEWRWIHGFEEEKEK